ncbi:GNAT family N-acetyltransferase [Shouchella patagoniensis]|uniref:GNAT family N-acetyltransferase n=1 Tax=Shouchella patagoniensis TaxID=228576 RepID=UPI001115F742|nr:GNAT family N-acetyltransferase [Shouchella patagoniensis]
MTADPEDLAAFLDREDRGDTYFSVYENEQLVGYFCFQFQGEDELEMSLGMRPDLTGVGKGSSFLHGGLDFVRDKYHPKKIILTVATFNQRAIKVYQKAGFIIVNTYSQQTNGGIYQ